MESQRMEFQDLNSVHHHLKVEWAAACKNGGVGGKVQVGCLIYTYNGGIMPGREYDW
ncbi:hypothetical protein CH063_03110 [Colletotrichum higginsianum]|uniref:Uncharacterized protein n=1 Tax=Colletotrichum higginsianum (strain IMI 349063) TaxID=759273 RepID=H1VTM9_COLHI|nr:hypothetical protein CH063_03110 [Colletotrichum higginsianum]